MNQVDTPLSDKTLDRAEGGMGVGLTLVRSLVEMHGGSVEARSDGPGCGSEFRGAFGFSTHQIRDPEFLGDRERPR